MSSAREAELRENLARVKERISLAIRKSGRSEGSVKLVAVSKTKPWTDVMALLSADQFSFGENYVQEAVDKIELVAKAQALEAKAEWHFIGTLQSNKAKFLPGRFSLFHGLHSESLAEKIHKACEIQNTTLDCLIEVNVDGESSKGGVAPEAVAGLLEKCAQWNKVRIRGLMCIPMASGSDPRRSFSDLRELRDRLNLAGAYPEPLHELSMGMTSDFEAAIAEGSTIVRVGTAIFGARESR